VRQENSRKNKHFLASRPVNKAYVKVNKRVTRMTGNRHLSILTLNLNDLNAPINRYRIEEQIGLKNKSQPYVAYKRLISLKKINTGLESKGRKRFSR
jgi:hypothetical protein